MKIEDCVREYDGDDLTPLFEELHQALVEVFQATRAQSMQVFYQLMQVEVFRHWSDDGSPPDRALVVGSLERIIKTPLILASLFVHDGKAGLGFEERDRKTSLLERIAEIRARLSQGAGTRTDWAVLHELKRRLRKLDAGEEEE